MNFRKPKFLAVVAVVAFGASQAAAVTQVTMGTFDAGSSGHFRADPNPEFESVLSNYALGKSIDGTWFGTFCLERNEYFKPGNVYDVELNNGTISGGESGAVGGKDIISIGTAWLYERFALGTLPGFVYGSLLHAKQLQNTLWELEGELSGPNDFGTFLALAQGVANYQDNYTGSAVRVMNLTSNGGRKQHQDQLVYVGYQKVPDGGATIAMLFLGLTGLATLRRKTAKS